jgi:hypothetical protein
MSDLISDYVARKTAESHLLAEAFKDQVKAIEGNRVKTSEAGMAAYKAKIQHFTEAYEARREITRKIPKFWLEVVSWAHRVARRAKADSCVQLTKFPPVCFRLTPRRTLLTEWPKLENLILKEDEAVLAHLTDLWIDYKEDPREYDFVFVGGHPRRCTCSELTLMGRSSLTTTRTLATGSWSSTLDWPISKQIPKTLTSP